MNLDSSIEHILQLEITPERREILQVLIDFIQSKKNAQADINLHFICTHNSRRSQFAQVWAQVAAHAFSIPVKCFSGGVEVTAFNVRAVNSLKRFGFLIASNGNENPVYTVEYALNTEPLRMFSKLYDDPENKTDSFAAVMTCNHADENCPFIPGTEKRVSVNYEDPKEFDGTIQESQKYDERSSQIASEMFYVFSKIK